MNTRGKLLLFFALVAGTFCALVTKAILNQIPETEDEAALVREKTIPTMVAKRDLLPGDEITPQNIRFDRLPESQVPTEAVNFYSDAKHRTLIKGVGKGQLISIYDLNESETSEGGYYTPLNSSCASFLIGSVIGSNGKGEEFLEDIKRNINPGVDKVDFYLTSEKRDEDSHQGGKPLQRTSTVTRLLDDVDIYQVKVIQKATEEGQLQPRLELSFILNDDQLEKIEEAEQEGRVTIEFSADDGEPFPDASPLFEIEPAVIPAAATDGGRFGAGSAREPNEGDGSSGMPAASPFDEPVPVLPTDDTVSSEEALVPAQTVSDSSTVPAQTAEMTVSSPPGISIPRPRMSVPRPLAATGN